MPSKKEKLGFRIEDGDDNIRAFLQPFREANQLSDIIRILIIERRGDPIPPELEHIARKLGPPPNARNEDAIDELRDHQEFLEQQIEAMQQAISVLQQSGEHGAAIELINRNVEEIYHAVSQLARKLDQLSARVDTMQVIGAVEVDTPPPTTREERLSSKLKSISFGALH